MKRVLVALLPLLAACGAPAAPATTPASEPPRPCFTVVEGNAELRQKDASKTLDELAAHIRLSPEDEALRQPKSLDDVKKILRRDVVYLFADGAKYARTLNTTDGRIAEAQMELLLGESQLVGSQVLAMQSAWVSGHLRIARAALASEQGMPSTDRGRMLAQLIRVVEEGNKIADALGAVAPPHLARGAEVIRGLQTEAPNDPHTSALLAEYHRLRGEWNEFDAAIVKAEAADPGKPAVRYLRAMEQLERFRRPEKASEMLRSALTAYPKFVRAQAALVLTSTSPRAALREIGALRQMNPDHYLVMLVEPTLAADQELTRMQGDATH